ARWYAEAFNTDPRLLAGPADRHLYDAARAAAQAAAGQGRDAADLDEKTRVGFRQHALDWLQAELEARRRLLEQEPGKVLAVAHNMQDWLEDPHFAGVRDADALAQLSEPERQVWQKLWAEVQDTLARAVGTTPPETKAGSRIPLPEL